MDVLQSILNLVNTSPLLGLLLFGILVVVFLLGLLTLVRAIVTLVGDENKRLLEEIHAMNQNVRDMLNQEESRISLRQQDLAESRRHLTSLIDSQADIKKNSVDLANTVILNVPKAVWESEPGRELIAAVKRIADGQTGETNALST